MNCSCTRIVAIALVLAALAPVGVEANTTLRGQRLTAPEAYASSFAQTTPAVKGDWIAVSGRLSDAVGDGRVYVFQRQAGGWSLYQELAPPDAAKGADVVVFVGDTLVVGSPNAWDPQVSGNAGAVSLYTLQNGQWTFTQAIYSYTGFMGNGSGFGSALAGDGTTLFVGFPGYVNTSGLQVGDVEAYDLSSLPAAYVGQIVPTMPVLASNFGSSLAADTGLLAVGADSIGLAGVGASAGAIYSFSRAGSNWSQDNILTAPAANAYDYFPGALVFDHSRIVAGNANFDSQRKGGPYGAAFSYRYASGGFCLENELPNNIANSRSMFGTAVTSVDGLSLVSAVFAGTAGQVNAYRYANGGWQPAGVLSTDGLQDGDGFGVSMATDGTTLAVGSSEALRSPASAGALYVFSYPPTDRLYSDGFDN